MNKKILIVDDEKGMCSFIKQCLEQSGYEADYVHNGEDAIKKYTDYDLLILDVRMPGMSGTEVLNTIKQKKFGFPVIIMSAYGDYKQAFELLRKGADDYLQKPFNIEDMLFRITKTLEVYKLQREIETRRAQGRASISNIIYKNTQMKKILDIVDKVAKESVPILITGESGTGKELIAKAIHYNTYNPRKDKPFWIVNCSALSETLLDDELFGHIKGAFTGAMVDRNGLFETADGGTIFLDEIADASVSTQARLLRIVETGEFRKLGETRVRNTDVRVVVATNKVLSGEVNIGKFREDLYQRLKVVEINIPPLRERTDDIPELLNFFLGIFNKEFKRNVRLSEGVLEGLSTYPWPGNVRELKHTVQKLVLLSKTEEITLENLPRVFSGDEFDIPNVTNRVDSNAGLFFSFPSDKSFNESKEEYVKEFEKFFFNNLIKKNKGNISRAAKAANMTRKHLTDKLKDYGIDANKYRK